MKIHFTLHIYLKAVLVLMFLLSKPITSFAQYSIAPTALWITYPNRSTDLIIRMAPDTSPMEFNLSAEFLIPSVDSTGNYVLSPIDSLDKRNLAPYLRFSPRRFTLSANQEQIIRVAVQKWDSLGNGEYWARVITSAKTIPSNNENPDQTLTVSMGVEIRTIAGILFRKGVLTTGLNVKSALYKKEGKRIVIDAQIDRLGAAAWIGTVEMCIRNEYKDIIYRQSNISNVYLSDTYRYVFELEKELKGSYELELRWITVREQQTLPLIPAEPISVKIPLVLN